MKHRDFTHNLGYERKRLISLIDDNGDNKGMPNWFAVDHLDVERLLAEWRWLCPDPMSLVARNAFGDLFLCNQAGQIHRLDAAIGKLRKVADSEAQFKELSTSKREEWFAESDEAAAAAKGLKPNLTQCVGFSVPLVLRSSPTSPNKPYVADLYEHIAFLGDINQQVAKVPDGTKVRLVIGEIQTDPVQLAKYRRYTHKAGSERNRLVTSTESLPAPQIAQKD